MSQRFDQLKSRHSQLLLRTAAQRRQLADTAGDLEHELGRIDRGLATLRRAVRSPAVLIGGAVIVGLLGPKRLLGWAARGLMYYSTARRLIEMRPLDKVLGQASGVSQPPRIRRSNSDA